MRALKTTIAAASLVLGGLALSLSLGAGSLRADAPQEIDMWPSIKKDAFGDRDIADGTNLISLDAPYRAEDAALVPITIKIPEGTAKDVTKLTLVIDKNPVPIAAEFSFGPGSGGGERTITTRVRFDMYSHLRAVVETADGKLFMTTKYVKAAGGCSAPSLKDADEALANIGKMQVKVMENANLPKTMSEGQVMIKHPNYSGMQLNQVTGLYIPAKYVQEIEVKRGSELVFKAAIGISLSEDPNIRFTYATGDDPTLEVVAKDSDGRVFNGKSSPKSS